MKSLTLSILSSSRTSLTYAIRGTSDEVLVKSLHPRAYIKAAHTFPGFVVWVSDYAAGYGLTLNEAWADAVHVLTSDGLTHERLCEVWA